MRGGALPNLIVIGAHKCGTSSLHYYLDLHPQVSMSSPKELNFFIDEFDPPGTAPARMVSGNGAARHGNWPRGLDWYASHFAAASSVRGESSPAYTAPWRAYAAERMGALVPDAKLIFLVRDPVARAVSHYRHLRAMGIEPLPPGEALTAPDEHYLEFSRYSRCLEPFLEHFPRERILIATQEDLKERRRDTMRAVFQFLGVDESFWSPKMGRERNPTAQKGGWRYRTIRRLLLSPAARAAHLLPQEARWHAEQLVSRGGSPGGAIELDDAVRSRLVARLKDDADRLRALAGRDFPGWSV